ncbi:MAG: hypothetical protein WAW39_29295 [Prosthecobacter sp.]|uniref:hypothetical protein n=1 Tax=Prosthecobacter sp. TaxID=1965333 RepID=UPI003BAF37BC
MKWILALLCVALASCMTFNVNKIGAIDTSKKTIAVSMGGGDLANSIKSALRADGWKVSIIDGLTVNPGAGAAFAGTRGSRYTMKLTAEAIDLELGTFQKVYSFDMTVLDNATGEEIANGSGHQTAKRITRKVMEALK